MLIVSSANYVVKRSKYVYFFDALIYTRYKKIDIVSNTLGFMYFHLQCVTYFLRKDILRLLQIRNA